MFTGLSWIRSSEKLGAGVGCKERRRSTADEGVDRATADHRGDHGVADAIAFYRAETAAADQPKARFAFDLQVPPTSNQAERDLRPSKIQQKISGRLTSTARTKDRYTILGYVSTAAKHHRKITPLRHVLTGCP